MDTLSNKELRLLIEVINDNYTAVTGMKASIDYIQYSIWALTGNKIAKSKIKNVKPFKKIIKKKLIVERGQVIETVRKRNKKKHRH